MRVPIRRGEQNIKRDDGPAMMTAGALQRLNDTLADLERAIPIIASEVATHKEQGDLSENFEYQDAKHRLRALHGRIANIKDKIKRAQVITRDLKSDKVQLGSTVVIQTEGQELTFEILGSQEADPSHGRISDRSPLGSALLGHAVGDIVTVYTASGEVDYKILKVL